MLYTELEDTIMKISPKDSIETYETLEKEAQYMASNLFRKVKQLSTRAKDLAGSAKNDCVEHLAFMQARYEKVISLLKLLRKNRQIAWNYHKPTAASAIAEMCGYYNGKKL